MTNNRFITAAPASTVPLSPLALFRKRLLSLDPTAHTTGWEDVLVPHGVALAGHVFGDKELTDWADRWFEHHHAAGYLDDPLAGVVGSLCGKSGHVVSDYCGNWGGPLVFASLHCTRPDSRYVEATRTICDGMLRHAVRLADGTFAHGGWEHGRKTIWVDTLYYASSVLSAGFSLTGEKRYAEEAVRQARLHAKWLRDETTGGWFHDVDPATGLRTGAFWARGNGWIILALADTLRLCPSDTPGWEEVMADYRSLVTCLLRLQHPSGLWRIVPENDSAHLETSGTTMILTGMVHGLACGWLEVSIKGAVMRGVMELLTWIDPKGVLQGAQRPAGLGGWDTHKLSTLGECTYATGLLWRLLADLRSSGYIEADALRRL
jgi:rhamnogalacturonyl hydrolase YesR